MVQDQIAWDSEQPGIVKDMTGALELDDFKCLFKPKPFYDSTRARNFNIHTQI